MRRKAICSYARLCNLSKFISTKIFVQDVTAVFMCEAFLQQTFVKVDGSKIFADIAMHSFLLILGQIFWIVRELEFVQKQTNIMFGLSLQEISNQIILYGEISEQLTYISFVLKAWMTCPSTTRSIPNPFTLSIYGMRCLCAGMAGLCSILL